MVSPLRELLNARRVAASAGFSRTHRPPRAAPLSGAGPTGQNRRCFPVSTIRAQGVEPRSPRSERGVLPVRRPRSEPECDSPSVPRSELGCRRRRRSEPPCSHPACCHARITANDVVHATRLPFDPGSRATQLRDCGVGERPTWRSFGARRSCSSMENRRLKPTRYYASHFPARRAEDLSLSGGASSRSRAFSS